MTFRRRNWLFIAVIILGALAAGCARFRANATVPAVVESLASPTTSFSPTPRPTRTPLPTVFPSMTPEPSATLAPTPTPDLGTDFSQARVYTAGHLPDYRYFVAISLPGSPKGEFYALVDGNKAYTCNVLASYPNRLYCTGRLAGILKEVDFKLYARGVEEPLFKTRIYIPDF